MEKCISKPAQACADTPGVKAASTTFHWCRTEAFPADTACPVSERRHKENIREVVLSDKEELKRQILSLKLSRYNYIDPMKGAGPQLGFMIDDHPDASFVTPDGKRVNLYAYLSALVATVQLQQEEIKRLQSAIAKK